MSMSSWTQKRNERSPRTRGKRTPCGICQRRADRLCQLVIAEKRDDTMPSKIVYSPSTKPTKRILTHLNIWRNIRKCGNRRNCWIENCYKLNVWSEIYEIPIALIWDCWQLKERQGRSLGEERPPSRDRNNTHRQPFRTSSSASKAHTSSSPCSRGKHRTALLWWHNFKHFFYQYTLHNFIHH